MLRNVKKTVEDGKELEKKKLLSVYTHELNELLNLSKQEALDNKQTSYTFYLISNAIYFGEAIGFKAGMKKAKERKAK